MAKAGIIPERKVPIALAIGLILLGALLAYHNSFSVPFLFDDGPSIVRNPTIRHLDLIGAVLSPPSDGQTVTGRPVVNLSLAVNYALGGDSVRGYHVLNLAIHCLAGLTLFGIVRRTRQTPTPIAASIALLWTVHPLQTESVTYIVQRAESLMGLFYLLTLYCFIRGTEKAPSLWLWLSIAACLLGMASKEVMVSAPLIVLLYDRTFAAGSFREALRRRRWFYSGLAGTWAVLGLCMLNGAGMRGGSVGYGFGVAWWRYALIQTTAIAHYLRLGFWPDPLVFDYGAVTAVPAAAIVSCAVLLILLLAGTAIALVRRPALGFLGAWFFAILAPTSSVVPLPWQTLAEHRMYLALAPLVTIAVFAGYAALQRVRTAHRAEVQRIYVALLLVLAGGLAWLTIRRNTVYQSALSLWSDTVAKRPDNARANFAVGIALENVPGRLDEAVAFYEKALLITPDDAEVNNNLAHALTGIPGRMPEAMAHYAQALRLRPDFAEARNNLGVALLDSGRTEEAIGQFEKAVRRRPDFPEAEDNLGSALANSGRIPEALSVLGRLVRRRPEFAEAHNNFGLALAQAGRLQEAADECREALRLEPDYPEAQRNLGVILGTLGRANPSTDR